MIPQLVSQYNINASTKASLIGSRIVEPKMLYLLSPDVSDMTRLGGASTPILEKYGILSTQLLQEYGEACPEFIAQTTILGNREIKKYTDIVLKFEDKIAYLSKEILDTNAAIGNILVYGTLMTTMLTINLTLQILHLQLIDIFWTELSMALKSVWVAYAGTLTAGIPCFWPSPATGAMVLVLMAVQLGIEAMYLAYIFAKIAQYVLSTTIAILLTVLTYVAWTINLLGRVIVLSTKLFEQIQGMAGTIACIAPIAKAMESAISQYTSMITLAQTNDLLSKVSG